MFNEGRSPLVPAAEWGRDMDNDVWRGTYDNDQRISKLMNAREQIGPNPATQIQARIVPDEPLYMVRQKCLHIEYIAEKSDP